MPGGFRQQLQKLRRVVTLLEIGILQIAGEGRQDARKMQAHLRKAKMR